MSRPVSTTVRVCRTVVLFAGGTVGMAAIDPTLVTDRHAGGIQLREVAREVLDVAELEAQPERLVRLERRSQ